MTEFQSSRRTAVLLAVAVVALAGCSDAQQNGYDQCMRRELFQACMTSLPKGPDHTTYNDWAEVVSECGAQAQYLSVRRLDQVKVECRSK